MKFFAHFWLAIALIALAACNNSVPAASDYTRIEPTPKVVTSDKNFKIVSGQTIYVPVYSHIYHDDRQKVFNLAATLSIRNTDLSEPMVVTSVRYYDSNGKLVKQYLERPIQLDALASTNFVISTSDSSGGSGANFIVEWVAQTEISEPIVEAVMIGTAFQQGISFISPGKVIKSQMRSP